MSPQSSYCTIVLEYAFKLGVSRDQKQVGRYIELIEQRIIALRYKTCFNMRDTDDLVCGIRLQRAGHILGSAYVEVDTTYPRTGEKKRVVLSGELGAPHAALLPIPKPPHRADILVLESTYGDRNHEDRCTRRQSLEKIIEQALADKGTVLVPAFSIGRTQELLYELEAIIHNKTKRLTAAGDSLLANSPGDAVNPINWPELPIILDSPLVSRFTAAYRELQPFWNQEALKRVQSGRRSLGFEQLITVDGHGDHLRMVKHLVRTTRPAIVIAGNGMCSSERIVNYLKAMLGDSRHNVLFVGYQAAGRPGRAIQPYGPAGGYVDVDGERLDIKAGIASIGGYSAHADQDGLVAFVTGVQQWPTEIRLVHGESAVKQELSAQLGERHNNSGKTARLIF